MRYNIAAFPTLYQGVRFRSRLEARWAAFFDLVGWKWIYEPIDFGPWTPDFAVFGRNAGPAMVEVKPIFTLEPDVKEEVGTKCACRGHVYLFGAAPRIENGLVHVGWYGRRPKSREIGSPLTDWGSLAICWHSPYHAENGQDVELLSYEPDDGWCGNFVYGGPAEPFGKTRTIWPHCDAYQRRDYFMALWSEATNAVQWRPAR